MYEVTRDLVNNKIIVRKGEVLPSVDPEFLELWPDAFRKIDGGTPEKVVRKAIETIEGEVAPESKSKDKKFGIKTRDEDAPKVKRKSTAKKSTDK